MTKIIIEDKIAKENIPTVMYSIVSIRVNNFNRRLFYIIS